MYWEDRLTKEQYAKAEAAMVKFKASKRTNRASHIAYDELTNAGMTSEEADEMINILIENAE